MDIEEFDSGWEELHSSLDSLEVLNNYEVKDAMNGYEPSELQQQMLEMRNDPAMSSYHVPPNATETSTPDKDGRQADCTSLSSEIFLATRLLHDETLDSTTLTTLAEPQTSPYNDNQNFNSYLNSPLENEPQQDTAEDSIGLSHQQALDNEFLYTNFEQLSSERQDPSYDEESSNKSWEESVSSSEIMPAPARTVYRKNASEKKLKTERRKQRIVKIIKKSIPMNPENAKIKNPADTFSWVDAKTAGVKPVPPASSSIQPKPPFVQAVEERLHNNSSQPITTAITTITTIAPTTAATTTITTVPKTNNFKTVDCMSNPSTSKINSIATARDGRKVPLYLKLYKLTDKKYPEIYACKNCYGIFTALDSALFHQCLKKRRGRRPKVLADCLVPL